LAFLFILHGPCKILELDFLKECFKKDETRKQEHRVYKRLYDELLGRGSQGDYGKNTTEMGIAEH